MNFESLIYYGYSRDTYIRCRDLILDSNRKHAHILNIWLLVMSLVMFGMSFNRLFSVMTGDAWVYTVFFAFTLVWELWMLFRKKKPLAEEVIVVSANVLVITVYGIYMSVIQPYMAAVAFPVMLVVLALSYVQTFLCAAGVIIVCCGAFFYSSYVFKPMSIFYVDIFNVSVAMILALALHYAFQHMRISRYVMFYENIEIQRSLEIRSSFDTLTSLLNRGRFFSMAGEILKAPHEDYMVLCLFDLDGFKQINDRLGHQMGDKAIQIMGRTLLKGFNIDFGDKWSFQDRVLKDELSLAGRLGGDEYIVLLRNRTNRNVVRDEVQGILDTLVGIKSGELDGIRSPVGIYEIAEDDHDIDEAYMNADRALYQAKEAGKHQMVFSN